MSSILIKNVSIADAGSAHNGKVLDVLIENGSIRQLGVDLSSDTAQVISGKGKYISPGWISLMTDFAEPGYEQKETIQSGLSAAAHGGFAEVVLVPNTNPAIANRSVAEFVQKAALGHRVGLKVMGAISQKLEGKALAEMLEMYHGGAVAFTDGWKPVQNACLLQKALEYVKAFDGVIVQVPVMASLADGLMNEGEISVRLGMPGIPNIAETLMIHRDIELARYTDSHLHISGVSTAEGLAMIKAAKADGLKVSCSVTPYHLLFTDDALSQYDSLYKVNPPLRTEADRQALLAGLADGTIDCIAVHHRPQDWDAKTKEFEYAESGMATMEVVWPMLLKAAPGIDATRWADLLSNNIARIFGWKPKGIEEGTTASFTLYDMNTEWTLTQAEARSLAFNIPLLNASLVGKSVLI